MLLPIQSQMASDEDQIYFFMRESGSGLVQEFEIAIYKKELSYASLVSMLGMEVKILHAGLLLLYPK